MPHFSFHSFPDARRKRELSSQFLHEDCTFSDSLNFLYRFSGEGLSLLKSLRGYEDLQAFPPSQEISMGKPEFRSCVPVREDYFFTASLSRV